MCQWSISSIVIWILWGIFGLSPVSVTQKCPGIPRQGKCLTIGKPSQWCNMWHCLYSFFSGLQYANNSNPTGMALLVTCVTHLCKSCSQSRRNSAKLNDNSIFCCSQNVMKTYKNTCCEGCRTLSRLKFESRIWAMIRVNYPFQTFYLHFKNDIVLKTKIYTVFLAGMIH